MTAFFDTVTYVDKFSIGKKIMIFVIFGSLGKTSPHSVHC